ncbi:MAG: hypothetical protein EPO13_06305 [Actinomycetota bacterium]|nr:MAG: hypothetical protein EPO13_06305 [Actinomycetota bacterium]
MTGDGQVTALRRAVLAAAVLHDVEVTPADDGVDVAIEGTTWQLAWQDVGALLSAAYGEPRAGAERFRAAVALRQLALAAPDALLDRVRPVALPRGHVLHPGPGWPHRSVLGGCLDVGVGLVPQPNPLDDGGVIDLRDPPPNTVQPLLEPVVRGTAWDAFAAADRAEYHLARLGALAAERHRRNPDTPLRPVGEVDVVTLLASATFRRAIVADDPARMRPAAVPARHRGWLDLRRLDPAFALAAAALTEPHERGFDRPILITADEIVQVRYGGDPRTPAVADPVIGDYVQPPQRWPAG